MTMKRPIDIDAEAALAALRRARKRAEELTFATGTCMIQSVEGRLIRVPPRAPESRNPACGLKPGD